MGGDQIIVTAHQANYLPYLGFFEKISVSDLFVLVDDTQFVKRGPFGWIHRNRILGNSGEPQWLTIPVLTHDRYEQRIDEVIIDHQTPWARKHLRSIETAYRKCPFFDSLYPSLKPIYEQHWTKLLDLSEAMILWVLQQLDIKTPMTRSSIYQLNKKSSDYVLELAQKSGATHYLSGTHGKDYLDVVQFKQANMGLIFQEFDCTPYAQLKQTSFVSHLSTIDTLFQVGPSATRELLKQGGGYL
jgi:hypothetical protein